MTDASSHDVIIVGARCAGAALATFLARAGARVLVIDAAKLPSDMPLSTHFVHPPGLDVLDELGVGARVRAAAPASRRFRISADDAFVDTDYPDGRTGHCIRRLKLDGWLQAAAVEAGAELRDQTTLVDLTRDGERVSGVVVRDSNGKKTLKAGLVIGADGRNSKVARLTGAEEYYVSEMTRGGYWHYFRAPPRWREDPQFAYDSHVAFERDGLRYVFQTDDDLLLLVAAPPKEEAKSWGRDHRARYLEYLRASRHTAPLIEGAEPVDRGAGFLDAQFFFRRAVGPGFALVGDAGHFKDFVTGHGISDALIGAQKLARAILAGRETDLVRYWRERDVASLPLHFDALRLGEVGFNNAFTRVFFEHVRRSPELSQRLALVNDRKILPSDVVGAPRLFGWLALALLRGRFDALGPFLRTGRRTAEWQRELIVRRRLLDELDAATPPALHAKVEPALALGGLVPPVDGVEVGRVAVADLLP